MVPVAFSGNPLTPSAIHMSDVTGSPCNSVHMIMGKSAAFWMGHRACGEGVLTRLSTCASGASSQPVRKDQLLATHSERWCSAVNQHC